MTLTWIRLRRRRTSRYMIGSRGTWVVRVLQAFAEGPGASNDILDVRAIAIRRVVSTLPAPTGPDLSRIRTRR